ncbi:MAG TPA: hypothetical protein VLA09_12740 [Longimicrobiales bacterium]|nr:hypothetical protein [Longimicrobiales bacterium]
MLSLIFVGYEIRQNSAAVRGATCQSVTEASVAYAEWVASDERVSGLVMRVMNGDVPEDFSEQDYLALTGILFSGIRRAQNVYLQLNEGLISESAFEHFRGPRGASIFRTPYFDTVWPEYRVGLPPDFVSFFEREWME